jgi:hypothetical protein
MNEPLGRCDQHTHGQAENLPHPERSTCRGWAPLQPGIPLIDHVFVPSPWPRRDECDRKVSDTETGPTRQCGRPRKEHRKP